MARWERALVTGASAGIGTEIARQLVAEGTAVVLVARRNDRLDALRDELGAANVEVLVADLALPADLERVAARVTDTGAPIDLVVNNAGYSKAGRFWELPIADVRGQIDVNVDALVRLSHAAAARMTVAGRGTILNISSVAGNQPGPGSAVYNATKAFVTNFSEGLAVELRGTGVHVTASCPGLTYSEFHDVSGLKDSPAERVTFMWTPAADVARDALDAAARGTVVRVNGWRNRVIAVGMRALPRVVARGLVGRVRARTHADPAR